MDIFHSRYASRWCLGLRLDQNVALRLQSMLNIGYGMGQSQYQVLSNNETMNFEKNYNFIISHYEKEELEKVIPLMEKVLKDNNIKY